jgi:predicted phosphoribosyltransferase
LFPTLAVSRDSLVVTLSDGGIEVAYSTVSRCSCELLRVTSAPVGWALDRDVWLIDDGESPERIRAMARLIACGGPRRLSVAAPILSRRLEAEPAIDGLFKIYWSDAIDPDYTLYGRSVADPTWMLRSAGAARAWRDRWDHPTKEAFLPM